MLGFVNTCSWKPKFKVSITPSAFRVGRTALPFVGKMRAVMGEG